MFYYILGCLLPLPPTFVPSHTCTFPTLFTYIHPPFKVPALVSSHQRGARVVRGSKEGEGSAGYVILGFRVATTSVRAKCKGAMEGAWE